MTKIAVLVGSMAEGSINKKLAKALEELAPEGVEFVYPSVDLPLYDYEIEYPQAAKDMKAAMADADGLLLVTPEYNRSMSGVMKNALDWASRPMGETPFPGKPTAIIGASGGALGTTQAQLMLRNVALHLGTDLMGQPELYINYPATFEADGTPKPESVDFLRNWVEAFVAHVDK